MLTPLTVFNACIEGSAGASSGQDVALMCTPIKDPKEISETLSRFSQQGLQWEAKISSFWCLMCTAHMVRYHTSKPLNECLAVIGNTEADIFKHCATRDHLLRFEEKLPLPHYCPVSLHGQKVLLESHCIYPSSCFGPGKVVLDETLMDSSILAQDAVGGVMLSAYHQYSVGELVLPYLSASSYSGISTRVKDSFLFPSSDHSVGSTDEHTSFTQTWQSFSAEKRQKKKSQKRRRLKNRPQTGSVMLTETRKRIQANFALLESMNAKPEL